MVIMISILIKHAGLMVYHVPCLFMNCALAAVVVLVAVVVNTAWAVEDCTGGLWAR